MEILIFKNCLIKYMEEQRNKYIFDELKLMFPDANCELNFNNTFELIIAVCLSAQTTDKRVNMVTPFLFSKYKDAFELSKANIDDVILIIKSLGLSSTKAKNIIALSKELVDKYNGNVPNTMEELVILPGCGRKTASVVLSVGFNIPAIAVDTHVSRVANRLCLSSSNDVLEIEKDLKEEYDKEYWGEVHHLLLHFGRYFCKAKNPNCKECKFIDFCKKNIW